eukprot:12901574-Prorocentrum_lima.AAC.1
MQSFMHSFIHPLRISSEEFTEVVPTNEKVALPPGGAGDDMFFSYRGTWETCDFFAKWAPHFLGGSPG